MRFLLDTHSFLWFIGGNEQMPMAVRQLISNVDNEILISVASLWEIAIKVKIGKLSLGKPFEELIPQQLSQNEFKILPIHLNDLGLISQLPLHHRDPFD
ncbi:MAG: type II toxin-antitoxin system VapC family toxin [Chloroflexota bacterium]